MDERKSFWDPAKRAAYLRQADDKRTTNQALRDGDAVAASLRELWRGLARRERAVLQHLLEAGRPDLSARHGEPTLQALVDLGLLQYPRGVGGAWMRDLTTVYRVAPAVWRELQADPTDFLDPDGETARAFRKAVLAEITKA